MREVIVDFNGFEKIDDETTQTAHYGGAVYAREGEEVHTFYPTGTDRSSDIWENLRSFLVDTVKLNFDALEGSLQDEADEQDIDVGDLEEWYNLYYMENVGTYVKILVEDDGTVLSVSEHITLHERIGRMIQKSLVETLNGPGTHMAFDEEIEFGYKWRDGETSVVLTQGDEETTLRYRIKVEKIG